MRMGRRCYGEQVCRQDPHCVACRAAIAGGAESMALDGIPVRRYGTVPPLAEDEPGWEIEPGTASAPRTIAETGATAVFLAALGAAALAGWALYLH